MLEVLVRLFSRKRKRPQTNGICGTPAIMSGELKLVDEVVKDVQPSNAESENKEAAEAPFYLPPPPWINLNSSSRKSKSRK